MTITARSDQTLGDLIRESRRLKGSLRDFARELEISPSYLSDIENDRRIPAEVLLRQIAQSLALDWDDLMARAGRIGAQAERYLRRHPAAGILLRSLAEFQFTDDDLSKLRQYAAELARTRSR